MTEEGDVDQNAVIRSILESMMSGEINPRSVPTDNMAQLLAAAIAQAGQSIVNVQVSSQAQLSDNYQAEHSSECGSFNVNSLVANADSVDQLDEHKQRVLCVKLPIELRRRIIAMRKDGKKCRDIAKELKVSVSGVRKVWERFLATGMVHDRKPNSGRPRKYPVPLSYELQYTDESIVQTDGDSPHIEYVTISDPSNGEAMASAGVNLSGEGSVLVEGPLDVPGAMVEIVETDPGPAATPQGKAKRRPQVYREELLLRLIENCPLCVVREDATKTVSPHVLNLSSISKRPLYMESALGYPFGAIPSPKPFPCDSDKAQVILSDPLNPLGKELLASLGYSTKVYFNMCCRPSPLFDPNKVISDLPFFLGPGNIAETTQSVLQLLVNLCKDPVTALAHVPSGNGPSIVAELSETVMSSIQLGVPKKLSSYWSMLFQCVSDLRCCENFLSAAPPSAPCLLCHPYQELVKNLEIREPQGDEIWSPLPKSVRCSQQLTPTELPSMETDLLTQYKVEGKRGRRRKKTSEDQLIIDGQFEVPPSINESSSEVTTLDLPPTSSVAVLTTESDIIPLGIVLTPPQVSVSEQQSTSPNSKHQITTQIDQSQLEMSKTVQRSPEASPSVLRSETVMTPQQTDTAKHFPSVRRSLRKRTPKTTPPLKSISAKMKTRNQKSTIPPPNTDSKNSPSTATLRQSRRSRGVASPGQKKQDPMSWSVDDVVAFVASIPRCNYSSTFGEHEVDGESLLSLNAEMMVKLMGIKTGPALKICRKISELKANIEVQS